MIGLLAVVPIVVRRIKANARLLLAVVIGSVLAASIMSTMSIYTNAIRDLGLEYALEESGPDNLNFRLASTSQSSQPETYEGNRDFIAEASDRFLSGILEPETTIIGRSATFFPTPPGGAVDPADDRPRAHFNFLNGDEAQVELVAGELPAAGSASGDRPEIDVAVGAETAQRLGIALGDEFDLHPFWRDDVAPVRVTVVGLVQAADADAPFWVQQDNLFTFPSRSWDTIPMLIPEETFFGPIAEYLPNMVSDYTTLLYVDTSTVNARNADTVSRLLRQFDFAILSNLVRTSIQTDLHEVLDTFDDKLFFTRIPLLVLVLQVAAIVLYYLFMVSTMLVERQGGEIALLKSRGATTPQVMRIYVVEGLAIFAIAMAAGPPLAAVAISLLGRTPPFSDLTDGANLNITLTSEAYLWAASGALLAFVTLLVPAYFAARRTIVHQRAATARPEQQPFFLRYYLDLGLAAAGGVLLYQLDRRGGLVTDGFFGDRSVDPVLLLAPAVFILTVGIVFLRLFPLALRVLAFAVSRAQGTAVLIGMWQLVRNPVHYSRLVLLLMLATAVGMFAASFGATLDTSYVDRAFYESGAQVRLHDARLLPASGPVGSGDDTAEALGASAASAAIRSTGSQGGILERQSFEMLAVDADTFADVAYFRGDFAAGSLEDLIEPLGAARPESLGVTLPEDARWAGMWIDPVDMRSDFSLQFEAVDATGRYFNYILGPDSLEQMPPGWTLLVADLEDPGVFIAGRRGFGNRTLVNGPYPVLEPQAPLTITSVTLRSPTRLAAPAGTIVFSDLHVSSATSLEAGLASTKRRYDPTRAGGDLPDAMPLVTFDAVEAWLPVVGALPIPLNDELRGVDSRGFGGLELSWEPQEGVITTHGLQFNPPLQPVPVLASGSFLRNASARVGDVVQVFMANVYVEVAIAGRYDYFPTLGDTRTEPSLVADATTLAAVLNANPVGPHIYPDEIWLDGSSDLAGSTRSLMASGVLASGISSFDELQEAQQSDPLVAAGWEGILFISFAAILLLSAIGFLIYSYLTAQRRTLEFAVLRTMGFSRRQIAAVVGFEQIFVIGLGMIAGSLMGMRLGSLMIRYMGITETGDEVLPPMQLEVSWFTVGAAWLALGLVFLVTIGAVVLLYSRLALHRVLRIGET